jgi:hypothetical protein
VRLRRRIHPAWSSNTKFLIQKKMSYICRN